MQDRPSIDDPPFDPVPPGPRYRSGVHTAAYITLFVGCSLLYAVWDQSHVPGHSVGEIIYPLIFAAFILTYSYSLFATIRSDDVKEQRRKAGECPECGYDCRATPGRCPECGWSKAVE